MEIAGALSDCMSQSSAEGLSGPVYIAGHSLGGIMLETYIKVGSSSVIFKGHNPSPIPSENHLNSNSNLGIPALFA